MYTCPQNHQSDTADYCSVCGRQIAQTPQEPASPPQPASPVQDLGDCPQCAAAKVSHSQVFCESCGFNFRTLTPGTTPPPTAPVPSVKPIAPPPPDPAIAGKIVRWDVVVQIDANLYGSRNDQTPANRPDQTFTLFDAENLIGRATPGVRVQVPVAGDGGVSRRQAILKKSADGLTVRDLGSANGTQLNGVDLLAGVETPVKDGDSLSVGGWTRLTIRGVR